MTDTPEARAELTRIETEMKALSPTTDAWWASRGRRNDLRDAIDPAWRALHGFGTRPDQTALDAWPTRPEARWRILRAYIEDYCGERVGDLGTTTKRLTALGRTKLGVSVREWIARSAGAKWAEQLGQISAGPRIHQTERIGLRSAGAMIGAEQQVEVRGEVGEVMTRRYAGMMPVV